METPFLSIIMPVYKAEKYLSRSVHSILGQAFSDFELILIDDGSTDRCGELCDAFAAADPRVAVIHFAKNAGVIATRNRALEQARGEYITFVDADDEIDPETYQKVIDQMGDRRPDAVVFGVEERYYNQKQELKSKKVITLPTRYFSDQTQARKYVIELEKSTLYGYLWNKLYRAELIRERSLRIRPYPIASDFFFNCDFFMEISSLFVLDMAPYVYNRRVDEGLTSKFFPNFFEIQEDRVSSVLSQFEGWGLCSPEIERDLANIYVRYVFAGLQRQFDPRAEKTGKGRKKWLRGVFSSELFGRLIPRARSDNFVLRVMIWLLKGRHGALTRLAGRVMYVSRRRLPLLFARWKQNR